METIVIRLYIPAIDRYFDVTMPSQLPICRYIENLASQISSITQTAAFDSDYPVLCFPQSNAVLAPNRSLADLGVHDAQELLLV